MIINTLMCIVQSVSVGFSCEQKKLFYFSILIIGFFSVSTSLLAYEENTRRDFSAHYLTNYNLNEADPAQCELMCIRDYECKAWSYKKPEPLLGALCDRGSLVGNARSNPLYVSGVKGVEYDTNRSGLDYRNFSLTQADPAQCQSSCFEDPQCKAWTYVKPGVQGSDAICWLKTGIPQGVPDTCCASGINDSTPPRIIRSTIKFFRISDNAEVLSLSIPPTGLTIQSPLLMLPPIPSSSPFQQPTGDQKFVISVTASDGETGIASIKLSRITNDNYEWTLQQCVRCFDTKMEPMYFLLRSHDTDEAGLGFGFISSPSSSIWWGNPLLRTEHFTVNPYDIRSPPCSEGSPGEQYYPAGENKLRFKIIARNLMGLEAHSGPIEITYVPDRTKFCIPPAGQSTIIGPPLVVSWEPNRLDVFVQGTDNALWTKSWDGKNWSGYKQLGAGPIIGPPSVVSWGPNRIDVFVLRPGNALWSKQTFDGGRTWSGYIKLGAEQFIGPPSVVSWGPNRIDVFVQGTDNALWAKSWDGKNWSGYIQLGIEQFKGPPSVVSWGPNRLDVFVQGTDNALWTKSWDGTNWSSYKQLGAGPIIGPPSVVSWGPNRIDVFVLRPGNALWTKQTFDGGRTWSGYIKLGAEQFIGPPSVVSWGPNRIDVFLRGTDDTLWTKSWDGTNWSGYKQLGKEPFIIGQPSVVSWGPNRIDVFVQGADNALWTKQTFDGGRTWSGYVQPP